VKDNVVIGAYCKLTVARQIPEGFYLNDDNAGEAFLPIHKSPEGLDVGSEVEVFIHTDSDGEALATVEKPFVVLGGFASLRCTQVNAVGAFLDWGLPKELFTPFAEQHRKMVEGRTYVVVVCRDKRLGRLMASSRLAKHFDYNTGDFEEGQQVSLLVYGQRDTSVQFVVDDGYSGIMYKDSGFRRLKIGSTLTGYVKAVRDDNKLEVTLTQAGTIGVEEASDKILRLLKASGGQLLVHDKSSPAEIEAIFQLSKKAFKRALGRLFRKGMIQKIEGGIELL